MNKVQLLQEKAKIFHDLLLKYSSEDADAGRLLKWMKPLFIKIEKGGVIPPERYECRMALGKEPDFYERHRDVYSAESDFMAALEDWESQDWYKQLKT